MQIFGAAVCQAALIIRSPGSLLSARNAWHELCAAIDVVELASVDMNLAAALLPRLRRLQEQALRKLELFHTGSTTVPLSPSPTNRAVFAARLASPASSSPPKFGSSPGKGDEHQREDADDVAEIRALGGTATLSFRAARSPMTRSRHRPSGPLGSPGLRPPMTPSTPTRSSIATLPIRPAVLDGIAPTILDHIRALKPELLNEASSEHGAYLSIPGSRALPSFDFMPPISEAAYPLQSGPFMFDAQSVYSAAFPPGPGHAPGDIASLTSPLDPNTFWLDEPPAQHQYQSSYAPTARATALPPVTPRTVLEATIEPRVGAPSFSTLRSPAPSRPWSPALV